MSSVARDLGLLFDGHVEARRHEVGQLAGGGDGVDLDAELGRQPELVHHLVHGVPEVEEQRVELLVPRGRLLDGADLDLHERPTGRDGFEPHSRDAAQDGDDAAVCPGLRHADHLRHDPHLVEGGLRDFANRLARLSLDALAHEDGEGRFGVGRQVLREGRVAEKDLHQGARKHDRVV